MASKRIKILKNNKIKFWSELKIGKFKSKNRYIFAQETVTSSWNMNSASSNQYTLPSWANIAPGGTFTAAGLQVSGGSQAPSVTIVSAKNC